MSRITGRIEVLLNGQPLLNKAGATASGVGISGETANVELKEVMCDTGLAGFSETPMPAVCEVTVVDRDDIKLSDLAKVRGDGTVIFRSAGGGKVYMMEGATCTRNFTITGGEGETPLKFIGACWIETVQ
jgi:hypothetical protein